MDDISAKLARLERIVRLLRQVERLLVEDPFNDEYRRLQIKFREEVFVRLQEYEEALQKDLSVRALSVIGLEARSSRDYPLLSKIAFLNRDLFAELGPLHPVIRLTSGTFTEAEFLDRLRAVGNDADLALGNQALLRYSIKRRFVTCVQFLLAKPTVGMSAFTRVLHEHLEESVLLDSSILGSATSNISFSSLAASSSSSSAAASASSFQSKLQGTAIEMVQILTRPETPWPEEVRDEIANFLSVRMRSVQIPVDVLTAVLPVFQAVNAQGQVVILNVQNHGDQDESVTDDLVETITSRYMRSGIHLTRQYVFEALKVLLRDSSAQRASVYSCLNFASRHPEEREILGVITSSPSMRHQFEHEQAFFLPLVFIEENPLISADDLQAQFKFALDNFEIPASDFQLEFSWDAIAQAFGTVIREEFANDPNYNYFRVLRFILQHPRVQNALRQETAQEAIVRSFAFQFPGLENPYYTLLFESLRVLVSAERLETLKQLYTNQL